jgi:hypothetical protein
MVKISFETDNAAFDGISRKRREVARILEDVAYKVACGKTEGKVMDINGNSIGEWSVE